MTWPSSSHRLTPARTIAGTLLAAALAVGGCAADDTASPSPTTDAVTATASSGTTVPLSVTTTPLLPTMKPEEIEVRNVLDRYAAESTEAFATPGDPHPGLFALVAGEQKALMVRNLARYRDEGWYYRREGRGPSPHQTRSVEFRAPDRAIAVECYLDDASLYRQGSNGPVDASANRRAFRTTVIREGDGNWRLQGIEGQDAARTAAFCRGFMESP